MKIFVIGGVVLPESDPAQEDQSIALRAAMETLGRHIVRDNHDLLVCSPFRGTADLEALRGAACVHDPT
jgi:hypothetical protein